jgi:hypothetical protein
MQGLVKEGEGNHGRGFRGPGDGHSPHLGGPACRAL